jgi:hypothetical protein
MAVAWPASLRMKTVLHGKMERDTREKTISEVQRPFGDAPRALSAFRNFKSLTETFGGALRVLSPSRSFEKRDLLVAALQGSTSKAPATAARRRVRGPGRREDP